jgi:2-methylcitrate dehydratase PrpD
MLTRSVAEFVLRTPVSAMPEHCLASAREAMIDTIGCALAGIEEDAARIARDVATEAGARPVARIWGTGKGSSPADAAFANGVAAHVLDFDDSLPVMRGHPSATLVPAIFAVAEATGASGRDALASYVAAIELGGVLGRAIGHHHYMRGWHSTATIGAFTTTAAAARLWGLTPDQLCHAFGIAASMSAGLVRNFGSMTKSFHTGHAARTGIVAADMARRGFTADTDILDGPNGFLAVYGEGDGENLSDLVPGLGRVWSLENPGIFVKGWPCCYCNHRPVGGLLQIVERHGIRPDDVVEIAVGFAPGSDRALIKDDPQTGLEGKFSIEYAAAAAVHDRALTLDSFTDAAVHRPSVRALMKKVRRYQVEAEGVFSGVVGFTDVTLVTTTGRHEMRVDKVPGSPQWPLSPADREAKFLSCAGLALDSAQARALLDLMRGLSDLPQLSTVSAASVPARERAA